MICYIKGGERQSEEVCTAGSLWFTSRVSITFFYKSTSFFVCVSVTCAWKTFNKQTSDSVLNTYMKKYCLSIFPIFTYKTKVEIEKLFFCIS